MCVTVECGVWSVDHRRKLFWIDDARTNPIRCRIGTATGAEDFLHHAVPKVWKGVASSM